MHEVEPYWDERLFARGIEAVAWDGAMATDGVPKRIGIIFSELVDGQRLNIEERLFPNADETEYRAVIINDALQQRGIRDIRVEVFRDPPIHSDISITMEGEANPFALLSDTNTRRSVKYIIALTSL